jgi:putative peptidoglycan lipid II flippase
MRMKQGIAGTAAVVAVLALGSPAIGMGVEAALAWRFGTSRLTDEYRSATLLPVLASQIFVAQVGPWLIVPLMAERRLQGASEESWKVIFWLLGLAAMVGGLGAAGAFWRPRVVAGFLAPGLAFSPGYKVLVQLSALAGAVVLCASVLNGLLYHYKAMIAAQLAQMLPNGVLLGVVCAAPAGRETAVAWGLVWGAVMMLAAQIAVVQRLVRRDGICLAKCLAAPRLGEAADLLRRAAPVLALAGSAQITALIINRTLSRLPSGSIAAFGFAWKLLLIASIGPASLATVILPWISEAHLSGDRARSRALAGRSLRLTAIFAGPLCAFLFVMRESIVRVLFFRGAMNPHAAAQVSHYFGLALIQAPAGCLLVVLQRIFIGRNDMGIALGGAALASLAPAFFLGGAAARAGIPGMIGVLDIAIWSGMAYMLVMLARRAGAEVPARKASGRQAARAALVATSLCGLCAYGLRTALQPSLHQPIALHLAALAITGALCGITTYAIAGRMAV